MSTNVSWQESYAAAMLELDRASLPGRIEGAQAAIQQAMKEITSVHKPGAGEEMQALVDAQRNLQVLQRLEFRTSTPDTSQGHSLAAGTIR